MFVIVSNYLEALNNVSIILFDKTGTLTKGVFNVTDILPANGFSKEQVLEYAVQAESFSNHPIAKSILSAYGKEIDQSVISDYKEISISLSEHKTTENLAVTGAFTVSFATEDTVVPCDYVGVETATKVPDKFAKAGFTATKSEKVNAPLINELPVALECKVKSFEDGILTGEILNVTADESVLTEGQIDIKKLKPIAYDPSAHTYVSLGEVVGRAFSDGLQLK